MGEGRGGGGGGRVDGLEGEGRWVRVEGEG